MSKFERIFLQSKAKKFLKQFQRAAVALIFTFEILAGYFWPALALGETPLPKSEQSQDEDKIKCSIAEKYSIIFGHDHLR